MKKAHNKSDKNGSESEVDKKNQESREEAVAQTESNQTDSGSGSLDSTDAGVDVVEKELSDVKDRYMRLLAEYDNFRKRSQKEKEALYGDAVAEVTKSWLLVIDNIDRALASAEEISDTQSTSVLEGVALIKKQAMDVLATLGIEEIPCEVGGAFDPNLHAAVTHTEDESLGEQCVAQIFQKGYRMGDRVIRHTLVQVAN